MVSNTGGLYVVCWICSAIEIEMGFILCPGWAVMFMLLGLNVLSVKTLLPFHI